MTRVDADNDAEAEALLAKMPDLSPLIADAGNGGRYRSHDAQFSRVFPAHLQCVSHWCEMNPARSLIQTAEYCGFPETPA